MCLSKSSAIPQFSKIIFAIPQILITNRSTHSAVPHIPQFSMYLNKSVTTISDPKYTFCVPENWALSGRVCSWTINQWIIWCESLREQLIYPTILSAWGQPRSFPLPIKYGVYSFRTPNLGSLLTNWTRCLVILRSGHRVAVTLLLILSFSF